MRTTAPRPITVHDFRELPEGPPFYQLIEGDLFMSPSPGFTHQQIVLKLARLVGNHLEKHPSGVLSIAPSDVELSDLNAYEPDLYYVSNARRSILTEQGASGAPDLVIEVLSRGTAKYDKGVKRQIYARTGVKELWLVDPDSREISVYRLQEAADKPAGVYGVRQKFTSPLFPRLTIQVSKIFQR
jgi:Uma2 family endonuclease